MNWIKRLFKWLIKCDRKQCKNGCVCGKGETQITYPSAPPAPSTADAVKAYTESLPAMYQAQLEYGPKIQASEIAQYIQSAPALANIANQLQMEYAPQEAQQQWQLQQQYAPKYAAQQQELQKLYEPEAAAAKESLGAITAGNYMGTAPIMQAGSAALGNLQSITSPDYLTNYNPEEATGLMAAKNRLRGDIRSSWADRGLAQGGNSAFDESKLMSEFELPYAQAQEQMRLGELGRRQSQALGIAQTDIGTQESAYNRYLSEIGRRQNVGLSLAGRYNIQNQPQVSTPQISTPNVTPTNLMSSFTPQGVMNQQSQNYSTYAQAAKPIALQDTRKYGLQWLLS